MKDKVIKLKVPRTKYGDLRGRGGWQFCKDAFKLCVALPKGTRVCYLVATVQDSEDSFRITRPVYDSVWELKFSKLTRIAGNYLMMDTREALAKLYEQGYRAVHIEYDA